MEWPQGARPSLCVWVSPVAVETQGLDSASQGHGEAFAGL